VLRVELQRLREVDHDARDLAVRRLPVRDVVHLADLAFEVQLRHVEGAENLTEAITQPGHERGDRCSWTSVDTQNRPTVDV
jgi:hypothetical protein